MRLTQGTARGPGLSRLKVCSPAPPPTRCLPLAWTQPPGLSVSEGMEARPRNLVLPGSRKASGGNTAPF